MRQVLRNFLVTLGITLVLLFMGGFASYTSVGGIFALLLMIALPCLFMSWVDVGRELRKEKSSSAKRLFGILVGIPQAIFALASIVFGIGIIVYFFFGLTSRSGVAWLMLLISMLMMVFGIKWLRDVFIQKKSEEPI